MILSKEQRQALELYCATRGGAADLASKSKVAHSVIMRHVRAERAAIELETWNKLEPHLRPLLRARTQEEFSDALADSDQATNIGRKVSNGEFPLDKEDREFVQEQAVASKEAQYLEQELLRLFRSVGYEVQLDVLRMVKSRVDEAKSKSQEAPAGEENGAKTA